MFITCIFVVKVIEHFMFNLKDLCLKEIIYDIS